MSTNATRMYERYRKHPALFAGDFKEDWLHRDFQQILQAFHKYDNERYSAVDDVDAVIPSLLRKEMEGVYSFNAFSDDFVRMFNEEINNFYDVSERENIPVRRPNSMNNYGVIVNEIGMRPLISSFQHDYLWPLSRHLFPMEASQFDSHHSFIVRYRAEEDLGLDMHTDDSDVTFNVCLGENFTGATLSFCGMFGASNHRRHTHTYHHQVGRAILHLGNRRHGADNIESGRRSNLIVWNHNHKYRANGVEAWNRSENYEKEEFHPSPVCLSYTHDRDYEAFKELPSAAEKARNRRPWCPPRGKEYDGFRAGRDEFW
ncbi:hypothetical protein ACHAXR_006597 [Thalassiosira sp. AJA248-18]